MRVDYERFRVSWDSISEGNLRIVILEKNEAILSFLFENFFQQAIVSFNFIIILKEILRCLVISNNFCVFTGKECKNGKDSVFVQTFPSLFCSKRN